MLTTTTTTCGPPFDRPRTQRSFRFYILPFASTLPSIANEKYSPRHPNPKWRLCCWVFMIPCARICKGSWTADEDPNGEPEAERPTLEAVVAIVQKRKKCKKDIAVVVHGMEEVGRLAAAVAALQLE
ncbi:unnamed protein product [Zymoseptoria tritici ST99CH_3D7]|uniref:Uncharacterized protein n=1 Tax=Zymoseptoria tritici (strain ST99CH_3D7) TaxID=1276538 RepID=A0A1X7RSU7_ZYMT9|nr:unnamed protein product [Zymoseptoria tritici ST99CH_3D7]